MDIVTTQSSLPEPAAAPAPWPAEESGDYEIVLGRSQLASVSFVAIVVLVMFCAISYVAGKAVNPKTAAVAAEPAPAPRPIPAPEPAPVIQPVAVKAPAPQPVEAPLFQNPQPNMIYLQMGAVERGIAAVFAEGLRREGLQSFVAPGPEEKIFRVLIGPLKDTDAYRKAKDKVNDIGLITFAKRYELPDHTVTP